MPIDPVKLANLKALALGGKPKVCAYWKVTWNPSDLMQTRYYSDAAYHNLSGFIGIGVEIEARILGNVVADTQFEINPDLKTETIPLIFSDIDKAITTKFQTFKSGVEIELFYYYPTQNDINGNQVDLNLAISMWFGQLQAPQVYGHKTLQTVATNGFRTRELFVPKRLKPQECTANFGGRLPNAFAIRSNGCPYDRHIGGSVGNLDPATSQPYLDCPRMTIADCQARLGRSPANTFFLGFNTDASAVVTDRRSGYVAVSKGNATALKQPVRWVFGQKIVRNLQLLQWRREINASNNDRGWWRGVWEVCEGPVVGLHNVKVLEKLIEASQQSLRLGERGQFQAGYAPDSGNYSSTAHFMAAYGWVDPLTLSPSNVTAQCQVTGFREVTVYNSSNSGNGLVGTYYADRTFTSVAGTRVDPDLNFTSRFGSPGFDLPYNNFSIRWEGQIRPRYTETYTFTLTHDDRGRLYINNVLLIDKGFFEENPSSVTIALTANTLYNIKVELIQDTAVGGNNWSTVLQWSSASQALEVVPNSRLTHSGASGYSRQWSDDRVWCLLEIYTNQKAGMAYPESRFTLPDFQTASLWSRDEVSFTHTFPDGEVRTFAGRRTTFDATLEGRPVAEQIEDICRSGALSVPFQHEGDFTIRAFRPFTSAELTAAPVFTDTGATKTIIWGDGQPAIDLSQTPDDKIVNEIVLTYEEQSNLDAERPITVDDPNQKLRAGRALGENNLQTVLRRDPAFGCRYLQEVVRLGYRKLRFGDFDEGGIQNNLRATFTVPFEQALGVVRYGVIKIVSSLLTQFTIGTNNGVNNWVETPQYFRVLSLRKVENGRVQITAQAYNQTAYAAFETVTTAQLGPPSFAPSSIPIDPPTCVLNFNGTPVYNDLNGTIEVNVTPC